MLSIVVGEVLKSMGYNVEYKSSDTQLQYQALATVMWISRSRFGKARSATVSRRRWRAEPSISASTTRSPAKNGGIRHVAGVAGTA